MRGLRALGRFLERDFEVVSKVGAALRSRPPPAAAPNTSPKPKMSPEPAEDVFEAGEDARIEAGAAAEPGMAEAVVHAPLVGVGQDGVRLGRFLELVFGFLVAGIAVGVILQRQLAVRALDLLVGRGLGRRPGPRSSRACSRLRYLHHRRAEQALAQHVAAAQLLHHFAFAVVGAGFVDDRLVEPRDRSRRRPPGSA